jgi:ABC-type polysaccharide/polyol phosphate export permease
VTALLYGSPVLYPLQHATGTLNRILACNPLAPLFELTRRWVVQPDAPVQHSALDLAVPAAIYALVCGLAVWVFSREAPRIAEEL